MKKLSLFFVGVAAVAMCGDAFAAVKNLTPKKAQAVAIQEDSLSTSSIGTSLLPSVIGLATNVIQINKEQKELSSKCEPTTSEIEFVNNMMKEWAMAGAENPIKSDSTKKCEGDGKTGSYKIWLQDNYELANDEGEMCFEVFAETDESKKNAVWNGFPKASMESYCSDGSDFSDCSTNSKRKATNMWLVFSKIDFDEKDYTVDELTKAKSLLEKLENCSVGKLAAKRKEAFGGLITNSINNMGQTSNTNTGSVMEMVSGLAGQKGVGGIGGIANMAGQFLNK